MIDYLEYLLGYIGFDTAENEPSTICYKALGPHTLQVHFLDYLAALACAQRNSEYRGKRVPIGLCQFQYRTLSENVLNIKEVIIET